MNRITRCMGTLCLGLLISCNEYPPEVAGDAPVSKGPTNFNACYQSPKAERRTFDLPDQFKSLLLPNRPMSTDDVLGVPTFLWASKAAAASVDQQRRGPLGKEGVARAYLELFSPLYRQDKADLEQVTLRYIHDQGQGPIVAKYRVEVGGVPVFGREMNVLMNQDLELIAVSGSLSEHASDAVPAFVLSFKETLARAYADLTGEELNIQGLNEDAPKGRFHFLLVDEEENRALDIRLKSPTQMHKVLYQMPDRLIPAYYMMLVTQTPVPDGSDAYAYVISAEDGVVLLRQNLVSHQFSYRVWADPDNNHPYPSPHGSAGSPHPTKSPDDYDGPPFIPPNLITLEHGPISTEDPWLTESAQETVGNNVDAYVDQFGDDGLDQDEGDFRATLTGPGELDRVYDVEADPTANADQQMAAVTQLFYTINYLHDWFYDSGFDEPAGNAQADNYGRGGEEGDPILAEAQDFSGVNNANMLTPADGYSPRMQQFLFSPVVKRHLTISAPDYIAGEYEVAVATFGPDVYDVTGEVALANDGVDVITDGCERLTNGQEMLGKLVTIDRGTCSFTEKVSRAENGFAIGAIVVNHPDAELFDMTGNDETITIPAVFVNATTGDAIKDALAWGDPVTLRIRKEEQEGNWRDSALDNTVVAHEWGHYLHHRLTDSSSNQSRAVSEGWGDMMSILLTVEAGDDELPGNENFSGVYPTFSGYSDNEHYFTIRRYPLSTDMVNYNPLTFKHIEDGIPLPEGPPVLDHGAPNSEVHAAGELWSAVMWEVYVSLLTRDDLTFDEAQSRMKDYVVAGLKMTPADATFTESRDALLAVVQASDQVDLDRFAVAFAKRGLGRDAVSPERFSTDFAGVVESFEPMGLAGMLTFESVELTEASSCDGDGVLDVGETAFLTVRLKNTEFSALENTTALVTTPNDATLSNGGVIEFPPSTFGDLIEGTVGVTLDAADGVTPIEFSVAYGDPMGGVEDQLETVSFRGNTNVTPGQSYVEDAECGAKEWTLLSEHGTKGAWLIEALDWNEHVWIGPDVGEVSDQSLVSPPLKVSGDDAFSFTFKHRYEFEMGDWDGGVVEISTDSGQSWGDLGDFMAVGYTGLLFNEVNPLYGREAYVNLSSGYPEFITETVDLSGLGLAGSTVQIRFRIGCDGAAGAPGWEIDNIAVEGVTEPPFSALEAEQETCEPTPAVVATAEADLETWESGTEARFWVLLTTRPQADVIVPLASSDLSEGSVEQTQLTFTPDNWASPQAVTVVGIDDAEADGNVVYAVEFGSIESDDPDYAGLNPEDVSVTNLDDDSECPSGVNVSTISDTAVIGGAVTLSLEAENQLEWEIRYGLENEEDSGVTLAGSESDYLLENITAADTTVTIRAKGLDNAQNECIDEVILPLVYETAQGANVTQTPDTAISPAVLGTPVTIGVDTVGASLAMVNGEAMIPNEDTLPRDNHWTYDHPAMANESLEIAIFTPGVDTPTTIGTVDVRLAAGTCPSGASESSVQGFVTIGAPAVIDLQGDDAIAFEIAYAGETSMLYGETEFEILSVTGDHPEVTVRALGTGPDAEPCTDDSILTLPFVQASASGHTQLPDSTAIGVAYGTQVMLELDTAGAIAVTVNGEAMIPDEEPATHHLNRWTLWHEATATEELEVKLFSPGDANGVSGGIFPILLKTAVCPENVDRSSIGGTALLGGSVEIACDGDHVDTFEAEYDGRSIAAEPKPNVLHDQTLSPSDDMVLAQKSDVYDGIYASRVADDFTVPEGISWQLNELLVIGEESGPTDILDVTIHRADNGDIPGSVLMVYETADAEDDGTGTLRVTLETESDPPLRLAPGDYWVSFATTKDYHESGTWFAATTDTLHGYPAVWENPGDGWQTGCTSWAPISECHGFGQDIAFSLSGLKEDGTPREYVLTVDNLSAEAPSLVIRGLGRDSDGSECSQEATLSLSFETAVASGYVQLPNSIPDGLPAGTEVSLSLATVGASEVTVNGEPMTPAFSPATSRENSWTAVHIVGETSVMLPVEVTTPGDPPVTVEMDGFRIRAVCDKVDCTASDDCHADGACNPHTGACDWPVLEDGTPCDDNNLCTRADACWSGTCVGGDPVICECHLGGGCDPATGACMGEVSEDGTACGDGDACYGGECIPMERSDTCRGAISVDVGEAYSGDLTDTLANKEIPDHCLPEAKSGFDAFHSVDLAPGEIYTIQLIPSSADLAIVVWMDCEATECVDAADTGGAGEHELIEGLTVETHQTVIIQVVGDAHPFDGDGGVQSSDEYILLVERAEHTDTDSHTWEPVFDTESETGAASTSDDTNTFADTETKAGAASTSDDTNTFADTETETGAVSIVEDTDTFVDIDSDTEANTEEVMDIETESTLTSDQDMDSDPDSDSEAAFDGGTFHSVSSGGDCGCQTAGASQAYRLNILSLIAWLLL